MGCGLGLPLPLHSNPIVQKLWPIYGKGWNVYVTDSALDKTFERGEKMTDGSRPVQTGFFFLSGHRCWKKEAREGGRERRKSGTEKDAKVQAGQRQPESVFVARGRASEQNLRFWKLLF